MFHRLKTQAGRTGARRPTQAGGRAGVRKHRRGDGLSSLLFAPVEEGQRRVDAGFHGEKFQAPGRIGPQPGG